MGGGRPGTSSCRTSCSLRRSSCLGGDLAPRAAALEEIHLLHDLIDPVGVRSSNRLRGMWPRRSARAPAHCPRSAQARTRRVTFRTDEAFPTSAVPHEKYLVRIVWPPGRGAGPLTAQPAGLLVVTANPGSLSVGGLVPASYYTFTVIGYGGGQCVGCPRGRLGSG